ncbi:DUF6630 family protein [Naasia lichenicola]|uniref:DUF6630 domain-containing protein n=1 Tax=Naasia lichenicola TaxID=2565933 RepID=A0A4S4FRU5_9MICO|nr:hypothetical protein [Naasia lichenicola]THG33018.1 hypothetical protein E6C64_01235 [Naasia lichenicola]
MSDTAPSDTATGGAAAWQRLCALIDDDPHLWPEVSEALDEGDDPWEALIGSLDDAGALAYLDVDDTGMELADALAQLPRVFKLQPDLGEANDTDELREAIAVADGILAEGGLRLLLLEDDDDDAQALVVVPAESVDDIVDLATSLGHTASSFG